MISQEMKEAFSSAIKSQWINLEENQKELIRKRAIFKNNQFEIVNETINKLRMINSMIESIEWRLGSSITKELNAAEAKRIDAFNEIKIKSIVLRFYSSDVKYFGNHFLQRPFEIFHLETHFSRLIFEVQEETTLLTNFYSSEFVSPAKKQLKIRNHLVSLIETNYLSWQDIIRISEVTVEVKKEQKMIEKIEKEKKWTLDD
jgi:hypothetical protein